MLARGFFIRFNRQHATTHNNTGHGADNELRVLFDKFQQYTRNYPNNLGIVKHIYNAAMWKISMEMRASETFLTALTKLVAERDWWADALDAAREQADEHVYKHQAQYEDRMDHEYDDTGAGRKRQRPWDRQGADKGKSKGKGKSDKGKDNKGKDHKGGGKGNDNRGGKKMTHHDEWQKDWAEYKDGVAICRKFQFGKCRSDRNGKCTSDPHRLHICAKCFREGHAAEDCRKKTR